MEGESPKPLKNPSCWTVFFFLRKLAIKYLRMTHPSEDDPPIWFEDDPPIWVLLDANLRMNHPSEKDSHKSNWWWKFPKDRGENKSETAQTAKRPHESLGEHPPTFHNYIFGELVISLWDLKLNQGSKVLALPWEID